MKLLVLLTFVLFCSCELVDDYVNLVESELEKVEVYEFAEDASEYKPHDPTENDGGTYDFIIVGAGPGGCILANRLTEIGNWTVLLLDAGTFSNNFTSVPHMEADALFSDYNWRLATTPQTTTCLGQVNTSCLYNRGRGIGGETIINGMLYARGSRHDYDAWAALGNDGWSYNEILSYFKKTECLNRTDPAASVVPAFHGQTGLLNVENPIPSNPWIDAFFNANSESGYNVIDYNGLDGIGVGRPQQYTKKGVRQDAGVAFIKPILTRPNLEVLERSFATKINIDENKTARSVQFSRNNTNFTATARKEIILASGVFGSAQLLMLSGIGPEEHLKEMGIDLIQDLEVGSALKDQVNFAGLTFNTNIAIPITSLREQLQDWLRGVGIMVFPSSLSGVEFFKSSLEEVSDYPDIEIAFLFPNSSAMSGRTSFEQLTEETAIAAYGSVNPLTSFRFLVSLVRSFSTGTLRLRSSDPYDFPLINPNLLSDEAGHDIEVLYQGIQTTLALANATAFQALNATLNLQPLPQCSDFEYLSKDYWYCAIRILGTNDMHGVSTCPMGPNPENGDVVDSRLRVHGINGLRVADASVIPLTVAGQPTPAVIMIGEKAADMIKEDNP